MIKQRTAVGLAALLFASQASAQSAYRMTREVHVGTLDGDASITDARQGYLLPTGGILAVFPMEHMVRRIGPSGDIELSFGRAGDGPGEFRGLLHVGVVGDTLYTVDGRLQRVTYFTHTGERVRELTWQQPQLAPAWPIHGGFAALYLSVDQRSVRADNLPYAVRRYTENGILVDTLALMDTRTEEFVVGGRSVRSPLADGDIAGFSPNGELLVIVERRIPKDGPRGTFSVRWVRIADKAVLRRRTFAFTAREMTDDAIAQVTSGFAASGAPPEHVRGVGAMLRRQKYIPPISEIVVVDDAVWLARERLGPQTVRWHRFTVEDGGTGYIDLAPRSRVIAGTGNMVWIAERDALDVPALARYRLSHR